MKNIFLTVLRNQFKKKGEKMEAYFGVSQLEGFFLKEAFGSHAQIRSGRGGMGEPYYDIEISCTEQELNKIMISLSL